MAEGSSTLTTMVNGRALPVVEMDGLQDMVFELRQAAEADAWRRSGEVGIARLRNSMGGRNS